MDSAIEALTALGLNELEAEVYEHLLRTEPMTAYRVAKALGRPTANVYKAVEALARAGAVVLEEGAGRLCRAVPAQEFLAHRRRALMADFDRAAEALPRGPRETSDQAIYRIDSVPLALERARTMLDRCTRIAVVDAFPGPLRAIEPALRDAAARGVDVHLLCYAPVSIPGARVTCMPSPVGEDVLRFWRSQQLNLVTDGMASLVALFDQALERVHQAAWTESLYLASILHAGMMREHTVHELSSVQDAPDALEQMREILARQKYFHTTDVPGQRKLLAQFGALQRGAGE